MRVTAIVSCAAMLISCSNGDESSGALPRERAVALQNELLTQLKQSPRPELRDLASTVSCAAIEKTATGARIGPWVFDGREMTIVRYHPPGSRAGYDFIYHVKYQDGKWIFQKLDVQEVRQ